MDSRPTDHLRQLDWDTLLEPLHELEDCSICPRDCHADRTSDKLGFCKSGVGFAVSSIFAHMGEEPVLSGTRGICNIFFLHCNMQCVYCQNYQISRNREATAEDTDSFIGIIRTIEKHLERGVPSVGFVSPSHFVPQVRVIMNVLRARGHDPVFVYNTNGYDRTETIASLEEQVDVYLPDLKYMDDSLARRLSDTPRYVEIATSALKEMYRQRGPNIFLRDDNTIERGMIIRHLVLPGQVDNSKAVLRFIADELSPAVHVSLMSQYHPNPFVAADPDLGRTLTAEEYEDVLDEFRRLGFYRGWVQALDSPSHYLPDFMKEEPFSE